MKQDRSAMRVLPAVALLLCLAGAAPAQVTFHPHDPGAIQPDENVLMDTSSGSNVFSHTNQTNTGVKFTSDENIFPPAQGQARIEASDHVGYKFISIELIPGLGFTQIEFDVNVQNKAGNGNIWIDAIGVGTGLPVQFASTVSKNGSNWFSLESTGDTMMTKLEVRTDVDMQDTRQWRIGGIGELPQAPNPLGGDGDPIPTSNVPEASSMLLLGAGLLPAAGFVVRRKRAK